MPLGEVLFLTHTVDEGIEAIEGFLEPLHLPSKIIILRKEGRGFVVNLFNAIELGVEFDDFLVRRA